MSEVIRVGSEITRFAPETLENEVPLFEVKLYTKPPQCVDAEI